MEICVTVSEGVGHVNHPWYSTFVTCHKYEMQMRKSGRKILSRITIYSIHKWPTQLALKRNTARRNEYGNTETIVLILYYLDIWQ